MILDQSHFFLGPFFGFGDASIWEISSCGLGRDWPVKVPFLRDSSYWPQNLTESYGDNTRLERDISQNGIMWVLSINYTVFLVEGTWF